MKDLLGLFELLWRYFCMLEERRTKFWVSIEHLPSRYEPDRFLWFLLSFDGVVISATYSSLLLIPFKMPIAAGLLGYIQVLFVVLLLSLGYLATWKRQYISTAFMRFAVAYVTSTIGITWLLPGHPLVSLAAAPALATIVLTMFHMANATRRNRLSTN